MTEKNKGGRPLKFKTPEELQKKIDEYFKSRYRKVYIQKTGEFLKDPETNEYIYEQHRPMTIASLAVFLGTNRQTLINYTNKQEYFDTVTRAKDIVEGWNSEALFDKDKHKGASFSATNNFKYNNSSKIEHAGNLTIEEVKYTK